MTNVSVGFLFVILFCCSSVAQEFSIEEQPVDSILSQMENNYNKVSNDFHQIALRTIQKAQRIDDRELREKL